MTTSDLRRWDAKYAAMDIRELSAPDEWLRRHAERLPRGHALELACGLGHNSIWLAEHGWSVDAVDISPVGLSFAAQSAAQRSCSVNWIAADLDAYAPQAAGYDLIIVFRFLDRLRLPNLIERGLRPGGMLIYETFSRGQLSRPDNHLKNSQFTLNPGELPALFPHLSVVAAEEVDLPDRCVARLAAMRPPTLTDRSERGT